MLSDEQMEQFIELFDALSEKHQEQVMDALILRHFANTGEFIDLEDE